MPKLTNPLHSLTARGPLGPLLTYIKHPDGSQVRKRSHPKQPNTPAQTTWRTMYQMAIALWHDLSPAEKTDWDRVARPHHMNGFPFFMSSCLKPNPGIYLPLAGGAMTGPIAMGANKITGLGAPVDPSDAARLADAGAGANVSRARGYRSGDWWLPTNAWVRVPLNAETYDNQNELDTTSKLGTASATTPDHLIDTTLNPFTPADVGKWVYNSTDYTYAIVTAYNSTSDLTLDTDIMANGEGYELYAGCFTATAAGYYLACGVTRCNCTLADKWYFAGLAKNGTVVASGGWQSSVGDGIATNCISGVLSDIIYLAIGDELDLQGYHSEGDAAKFRGATNQTYLAVWKLN
jgi:hypothetical protein